MDKDVLLALINQRSKERTMVLWLAFCLLFTALIFFFTGVVRENPQNGASDPAKFSLSLSDGSALEFNVANFGAGTVMSALAVFVVLIVYRNKAGDPDGPLLHQPSSTESPRCPSISEERLADLQLAIRVLDTEDTDRDSLLRLKRVYSELYEQGSLDEESGERIRKLLEKNQTSKLTRKERAELISLKMSFSEDLKPTWKS